MISVGTFYINRPPRNLTPTAIELLSGKFLTYRYRQGLPINTALFPVAAIPPSQMQFHLLIDLFRYNFPACLYKRD